MVFAAQPTPPRPARRSWGFACRFAARARRYQHRLCRARPPQAAPRELSDADPERLDDFIRHGMALQVAAALGVEDLSAGCAWVQAELRRGA